MLIVYLVSNRLVVIYNKKVFEKEIPHVIQKGLIQDKDRFSEEFVKLLKENKIKNKLLGEDIYVLKNTYYTKADLYFLENIFEKLGYLKVKYIDITEFFKENDGIYVEINNDYLVINLDKGILVDLTYFKNIESVLSFLIDYSKVIILFGENKKLKDIQIDNLQIYYIDRSKDYIKDLLISYKKN